MHHQNQHRIAWRVVLIAIPTIVGLLAGGMPGHAQSLDNEAAPATDPSIAVGSVIPDVEPANADPAGAPTDSADTTTADPLDDSNASRASETFDIESGAPGTAMTSNEASKSSSNDGAVLELPQVVNLQNGSTGNGQADGAVADAQGNAVASAQGNDDDSAQSGQDTTTGVGLATADQLGTLQDYEGQAGQSSPGPIYLAPAVGVVRFPRPLFINPPSRPLFNPPSRPLLGASMARSRILPPTSSGPFPSTSPMLMGPRMGTLGSFPRGGFIGFHR